MKYPKLKLSPETILVLKNFATINQSLIFKEGHIQRTVQPQKTIMAQATLKDKFPKEFAIYNLAQFIAVLDLCSSSELECADNYVMIRSGPTAVKYFYGSKAHVTTPPEHAIKLPSEDAKFTIEAEALKATLQAAALLSLPEIMLFGRDGKSYIGATDLRTEGSNVFEYEVGGAETNYRTVFKTEYLKILPGKYEAKVSTQGLAYLKTNIADSVTVEYWLPVDIKTKEL